MVVVVDDARHHGAAAQIDDPRTWTAQRLRVASHLEETAVLDRHGRDDPVLVVHRVDAAVDEDQFAFAVRLVTVFAMIAVVVVVMSVGATDDACTRGGGCALDELTPRQAAVLVFLLRHVSLLIGTGARFDRPAA